MWSAIGVCRCLRGRRTTKQRRRGRKTPRAEGQAATTHVVLLRADRHDIPGSRPIPLEATRPDHEVPLNGVLQLTGGARSDE
eukprot:15446365-Alexandrium_andersonii.AAC.1